MNDTPRLTAQDFKTLLADTSGPSVSLYLPTHRRPTENKPDLIHLKNLIARAERELAQVDGDGGDVLGPARALLDDRAFWQHQREGLALLLAPGMEPRAVRLPYPVAPQVVVGPRLHLKPLLPLVTGDGRFLVLTLSQNAVGLYEGSRYAIEPLDASALPASLVEALQPDEPERVLQYRSSGGGNVIFHGHGANEADAKDDLLRFFRRVDKGVVEHLTGERAPLVLAGVEYYFPIYRDANTYGHLAHEGIGGNPEHWSEEELHDRAWPIVQPRFDEARRDALAAYESRAGTGTTSRQVREILQAAAQGRVDTLFVAEDAAVWGPHPGDLGQPATVHDDRQPGDVDLLDVAASETVRNGGRAYALPATEIPARSPAAAVFRY